MTTTHSPSTKLWLNETVQHSCYINGSWVAGEGAKIADIIDPSTESLLNRIQYASQAQVEAAIESARLAFDESAWPTWTGEQRSRMLHQLCDLAESRYDELLDCMIDETGSPTALAHAGQVQPALDTLRWFAEAARRGPLGGYERGLPILDGAAPSMSILRQEPAGVVSAITAYNYPLLLLARKLGGVLASGCTTIVLPSERAPLSAWLFFHLLEEVGYPAGVANLVMGSSEAGIALSSHPAVDVVSFTGSVTVGAKIMAQASTTAKKVVLELGGKSPTIVLPGTNIAPIVAPTTMRYLSATGQGCGCTTRTLVTRELYDEYVERAQEFIPSVLVGQPRASGVAMGPLIRAEQRESVEGYVERALAAGGRVLAGGGRPTTETVGYFMNPVLIDGLDNTSEIAQNELFGPVGMLMPFDSVDEAIATANASRFGLNAAVFGPPIEAMKVARRLRAGTVGINGGGGFRSDAPWGGWRESGVGREGGEDGFKEFFETQHVQWPL